MASTGTDVIAVQPQLHLKTSKQIIIEGICAQEKLRRNVVDYYTLPSLYAPILLPFCCLLGKLCGRKAVDVWSMYLTSAGIFFVNYNAACVCCPKTQVHIALTDIEEIQEVSNIYRTGCCNYGTKISTTTIRLELKPNKAKEFFPLWYRCDSCNDLPIVIDINYCENSTEFVEAVKQQIVTMGL